MVKKGGSLAAPERASIIYFSSFLFRLFFPVLLTLDLDPPPYTSA